MQPSQWIYCFKSNDNHSDIYYKYHPTFQISYFNFAKKKIKHHWILARDFIRKRTLIEIGRFGEQQVIDEVK